MKFKQKEKKGYKLVTIWYTGKKGGYIMLKDKIQKRIYACKTDDDIREFLTKRIAELEENSKEITVGQNYTDSFNEYIAKKVHYKPAARIGKDECPDLVYDDMEPYVSLIKDLQENSWYNEMSLFTTIFWRIHEYLPNNHADELDRFFAYQSHRKEGKISIKDIKKEGCAFCSENAGLAHNMFKILGIDSSVICGRRDNTPHAYNMIYPKGYDNKPAVLFDPSHHLDFVNSQGKKVSFGFFKALSQEEYDKMKSGEAITLDVTRSGENTKKLYGWNGALDGYELKKEMPTYGIGLGKVKLEKRRKNDDEER